MKTKSTRELSTHAAAAKAIRTDLKRHFPNTRFKVRADSFAGGDAVDISWTDGPHPDAVKSITHRYQVGHFDGMTDCYEYSNRRADLPQVSYVMERRSFSVAVTESVLEDVNRLYGYDLELKYGTHWDTGERYAYLDTRDSDHMGVFNRRLYALSFEEDAVRFQPQPGLSADDMENLQTRFARLDIGRYEFA